MERVPSLLQVVKNSNRTAFRPRERGELRPLATSDDHPIKRKESL